MVGANNPYRRSATEVGLLTELLLAVYLAAWTRASGTDNGLRLRVPSNDEPAAAGDDHDDDRRLKRWGCALLTDAVWKRAAAVARVRAGHVSYDNADAARPRSRSRAPRRTLPSSLRATTRSWSLTAAPLDSCGRLHARVRELRRRLLPVAAGVGDASSSYDNPRALSREHEFRARRPAKTTRSPRSAALTPRRPSPCARRSDLSCVSRLSPKRAGTPELSKGG